METNETNQTSQAVGNVCFFCEAGEHEHKNDLVLDEQKCDCACHKK